MKGRDDLEMEHMPLGGGGGEGGGTGEGGCGGWKELHGCPAAVMSFLNLNSVLVPPPIPVYSLHPVDPLLGPLTFGLLMTHSAMLTFIFHIAHTHKHTHTSSLQFPDRDHFLSGNI